jgi:hypothetical protein
VGVDHLQSLDLSRVLIHCRIHIELIRHIFIAVLFHIGIIPIIRGRVLLRACFATLGHLHDHLNKLIDTAFLLLTLLGVRRFQVLA